MLSLYVLNGTRTEQIGFFGIKQDIELEVDKERGREKEKNAVYPRNKQHLLQCHCGDNSQRHGCGLIAFTQSLCVSFLEHTHCSLLSKKNNISSPVINITIVIVIEVKLHSGKGIQSSFSDLPPHFANQRFPTSSITSPASYILVCL